MVRSENSNNDKVYRTQAHTNEALKITGVKIEEMLMSGYENAPLMIIERILALESIASFLEISFQRLLLPRSVQS